MNCDEDLVERHSERETLRTGKHKYQWSGTAGPTRYRFAGQKPQPARRRPGE